MAHNDHFFAPRVVAAGRSCGLLQGYLFGKPHFSVTALTSLLDVPSS